MLGKADHADMFDNNRIERMKLSATDVFSIQSTRPSFTGACCRRFYFGGSRSAVRHGKFLPAERCQAVTVFANAGSN
jgi:hypothetical protein